MRSEITLLLCLAATNAFGYVGTSFQAFIEVGYPKILLSKEPAGEKSGCLWYSGARLDGKWQEYRFAFTPEDDGAVFIRFGPGGNEGIPCYYSDIRVNGSPIGLGDGWLFGSSRAKMVSVSSAPDGACLRLYQGGDAAYCLKVGKGVKIEVTMRARSGSFLEAYVDQLSAVTASLDEAAKAGPSLEGGALASGRAMAQCVNELTALSEKHLHVSVPPLSLAGLAVAALQAKTVELTKACEAEAARTAGDAQPCLYDQPKVRAEIRDKIIQAGRLADRLKTACLLSFMFGELETQLGKKAE
jgi:hypothetical protein